MQKIDERVDLSKKVLNVNIDSPIFKSMLHRVNEKIVEVIKNVYDEEFESGDISLKITLSVPTLEKEFPAENEIGEPITKFYKYKALQFKHNITTTLKKVDKMEETYFGDKELKEDENGNFIEKPIDDPQVSMFESY